MAKDASEKFEKITPSPAELIMTSWQEKLPVKCSVPGCNHVAANQSVMNLHKAKVHKIVSTECRVMSIFSLKKRDKIIYKICMYRGISLNFFLYLSFHQTWHCLATC